MKRKKTGHCPSKVLLVLFLSLFWFGASAQSKIIKGKVKSAKDNTGLPSASIKVAGTTNGVFSDVNGNYTITVKSASDVLVYSYIGFETIEMTVGNQSEINISLIEDQTALQEVVVIGYGSQKKSDVTGAVASVNAEELGKFSAGNSASLLQGRMAGVNVESNGGSPNAQQIVTIRGAGTLSDNGPIYVIDGMITGSMGSINPQDIETISVLKDASATAIYGVRGANGVIIVNTKKGKSGEMSIEANLVTGIQKATRYLPWANARQYADIVNKARTNDGNSTFPANDGSFNPAIDSDIQRESLRTAPTTNASLRFSGGGKNNSYALSLNYFNQEGIVKESDLSRFNIRANSSFTKGRFKLDQTLAVTRTIDNPNYYFNSERDIIPTVPIRDAQGNFTGSNIPAGSTQSLGVYAGVGNLTNSLGLATLEDRTNTSNNVLANLAASFEIFSGLTFKTNFGVDLSASKNYTFTPKYYFNGTSVGNKNFAELNERNNDNLSRLNENTLNYTKAFGKHNVNALLGQSVQVSDFRQVGVVARNFPNNEIRVASAAAERAQMPGFQSTTALLSYFGRVNYSFDDKYIVTATLRRDGSSLFSSDNRWQNFPSAALGWNIGKENFMQDLSFISNLKLRASYGSVGSNNTNAYAIDPEMNLNSDYIIGLTQTRLQGYSITKGVNRNIFWETTNTADIGVDFNALSNKLQLTMDYFVKNSNDVLVDIQLPLYTGFGNKIPFNAASIRNKGFEFSTTYFGKATKDFSYDLGVNFSILDNEVTNLGLSSPIIGGQFTSNGLSSTKTEVGQPIGSFYGYKLLGIYQSDEEAKASGDANSPRAGDLKFADLNGDGKINSSDQTYLGNPTPNLIYGINFNAQYKAFDVTLLFNGVSGNKILNGNRYRGYFDTEGNYLADALNAWTPTNKDTDIPRNTQLDPGFNRRFSDFYLENGSYFRLRNAQVGYTLPSNFSSKAGMTKARFYLTAQNLMTLTKYTGYYPEVGRNNRGGSVKLFNSGVDESAYPTPRTIQIGLQASF